MMIVNPTPTKIYRFLWNKYRPAIIRLMIDSVNGPQQYKLSSHEFKNVNGKQKGGYAFKMNVFRGRAVDDIRSRPVAQDLLLILQESKTASELIEACSYEFILDKHFVLHITRRPAAPANLPEQEVSEPVTA